MTIKYGEFTFDPCCGYTGSAGKKLVKSYMRGGYAEGGMRSESTQEAKATRDVQDSAMKPARQLNKALKNLNSVRKQTGYGVDLDSDMPSSSTPSFARGGLRKTRSDKGFTQSIVNANTGPGAQARPKIGQDTPAETPLIQSQTPPTPPALSGLMQGMRMGGRTKRQ